jgi:hypothetical protein
VDYRARIAEAKQRLPLSLLWRKLAWPGEPAKSCRVPFRPDDSRESGSVFVPPQGDCELFHDFKSGETLDAIAVLARVEGLENGEACRRFVELAGFNADARERGSRLGHAPPRKAAQEGRRKPVLPLLRMPTLEECQAIAASRGLLPRAVTTAAADGLLCVCQEWRGVPCWALTDGSGWNAIFRRMDGEPFALADGRSVKTLGIKGGFAAWPVGLELAREHDLRALALVEGAPDALAAYQVLCESRALITEDGRQAAGVLCMAGAALSIPADCLHFFANRRVRIFADADEEGHTAAARWECQLEDAGALVDSFDLRGLLREDGKPVKDLNDACRMTACDRASLGMWEGMNE